MNTTNIPKNDLKYKLLAYKAIGDSVHAPTIAAGANSVTDPIADSVYRKQLDKAITTLQQEQSTLIAKLKNPGKNSLENQLSQTCSALILRTLPDSISSPTDSSEVVKPASVSTSVSPLDEKIVPQVSAVAAEATGEKASVKNSTRVPGVEYYTHEILLLRTRIAALTASLKGDDTAQWIREQADLPLQLVLLVQHLSADVSELRKLVAKLTARAVRGADKTAAEIELCSELQSIGDAAQGLVDNVNQAQSQRHEDATSIVNQLRATIAAQRGQAEAQADRLMSLLELVIDSCVIPTKATATNAELAKRIKHDHKHHSRSTHHHSTAITAAVAEADSGPTGAATLESFEQQSKISKELQPSSFFTLLTQSSDVDREKFARKTKNLLQTLLNESVRESRHNYDSTDSVVQSSNNHNEQKQENNISGKSLRFIKIKSGNDPAVKLLVSYNIILQAPKNPYLIRLRPFGLPDTP